MKDIRTIPLLAWGFILVVDELLEVLRFKIWAIALLFIARPMFWIFGTACGNWDQIQIAIAVTVEDRVDAIVAKHKQYDEKFAELDAKFKQLNPGG